MDDDTFTSDGFIASSSISFKTLYRPEFETMEKSSFSGLLPVCNSSSERIGTLHVLVEYAAIPAIVFEDCNQVTLDL